MNNTELVQSYRQQIGNVVNQANLQLFWNMYNRCGRHGAQPRSTRPQSAPSVGVSLAQPLTEGGRQETFSPQFVDEQLVPLRRVTSCPGSHPSKVSNSGFWALTPSPLGRCWPARSSGGMWATSLTCPPA